MNKIKSIYKKNEEVTRLLVIMAVWLIFMAFTQARKFYTGMNFLPWRDSSRNTALWLWAVCYA